MADDFESALQAYVTKPKEDRLITRVIGILHKMETADKKGDDKAFIQHHEELDKTIHAWSGRKRLTPDEK